MHTPHQLRFGKRAVSALASLLVGLSLTASALAEPQGFAEPVQPAEGARPEPFPGAPPLDHSSGVSTYSQSELPSTVRILLGPVAAFGFGEPSLGLSSAVDIGRGAAGLRLAASWSDAPDMRPHSVYGGDLWLDFLPRGPWHPIVGLGAHLHRVGVEGDPYRNIAAGTLRGTIQYALPLEDTPGRAFIDASLLAPFAGAREGDNRVWGSVTAGIAIGF